MITKRCCVPSIKKKTIGEHISSFFWSDKFENILAYTALGCFICAGLCFVIGGGIILFKYFF